MKIHGGSRDGQWKSGLERRVGRQDFFNAHHFKKKKNYLVIKCSTKMEKKEYQYHKLWLGVWTHREEQEAHYCKSARCRGRSRREREL